MKKQTFKLYAFDYYFLINGSAQDVKHYPDFEGEFLQNLYEKEQTHLCIGTNHDGFVTLQVELLGEKPKRTLQKAEHIVETSLQINQELWLMNIEHEVPEFEPIKLACESGIYGIRISSYNLSHEKNEKEKYVIQLWKNPSEIESTILKQYVFPEEPFPSAYTPPNDKSGYCTLQDIKKHLTMDVLYPTYFPISQIFEEEVFYMVVEGYETAEFTINGLGGYSLQLSIEQINYDYFDMNEFVGKEDGALFNHVTSFYSNETDTIKFYEKGVHLWQETKMERFEFIRDDFLYDLVYFHPAHEEDAKQMLIDYIHSFKK